MQLNWIRLSVRPSGKKIYFKFDSGRRKGSVCEKFTWTLDFDINFLNIALSWVSWGEWGVVRNYYCLCMSTVWCVFSLYHRFTTKNIDFFSEFWKDLKEKEIQGQDSSSSSSSSSKQLSNRPTELRRSNERSGIRKEKWKKKIEGGNAINSINLHTSNFLSPAFTENNFLE